MRINSEEDERFAAENPIEAAIRTISIPPGWWLSAIGFSTPTGKVYVTFWPPTGHKAWIDGPVTGTGPSVDLALRDAQVKVYNQEEKHAKKAQG